MIVTGAFERSSANWIEPFVASARGAVRRMKNAESCDDSKTGAGATTATTIAMGIAASR